MATRLGFLLSSAMLLVIFGCMLIVIGVQLVGTQQTASTQSEHQIFDGDVQDAGNWRWIEIQNQRPIRNGNVTFYRGDKCGIGRMAPVLGGTIQAIKKVDGKILYEYAARGDPYGTVCPSGVQFFR